MNRYTVMMIDGTMETVIARNDKEAELLVNKKFQKGILEVWKEVENGNRSTEKGVSKV